MLFLFSLLSAIEVEILAPCREVRDFLTCEELFRQQCPESPLRETFPDGTSGVRDDWYYLFHKHLASGGSFYCDAVEKINTIFGTRTLQIKEDLPQDTTFQYLLFIGDEPGRISRNSDIYYSNKYYLILQANGERSAEGRLQMTPIKIEQYEIADHTGIGGPERHVITDESKFFKPYMGGVRNPNPPFKDKIDEFFAKLHQR